MWRAKAEEVFGIDGRSLALFRMGEALLLLWDLGVRATSLRAHYTDEGLLPRAVLVESVWRHRGYWSLHTLGGSWELQAGLFVLAAALAVMLLVGWWTRPVTCASWLLLLSLQYRNPLLNFGADEVMRALLFWSMFVPLGECWSIDARRHGGARKPVVIWGAPTAAILLQVCFVYWFTAWLKRSPVWWPEGTAIQHSLSIGYFATPSGVALLAFPQLLRALTYFTLALEALGPLMALCPVWNGPARTLAVALFWGLHIGMGLTLRLGHFPAVSMLGWVLFLPPWLWERRFLARPGAPRENVVRGFSKIVNAATALLLAFVFSNNARPIYRLRPLARLLGLEQHWSMFVTPERIDLVGFVAPALTRDGREIDLLHDGRPVSLGGAAVAGRRTASYWFNMWNIPDKDRAVHLPLAADYLCRDWNRRLGATQRVDTVEIDLVRRKVPGPGSPTEVERERLLRAPCPN